MDNDNIIASLSRLLEDYIYTAKSELQSATDIVDTSDIYELAFHTGRLTAFSQIKQFIEGE